MTVLELSISPRKWIVLNADASASLEVAHRNVHLSGCRRVEPGFLLVQEEDARTHRCSTNRAPPTSCGTGLC